MKRRPGAESGEKRIFVRAGKRTSELSDKGKLEGMECLARHEKLTQFFQMVSGMDQQRAQEDACRVEH